MSHINESRYICDVTFVLHIWLIHTRPIWLIYTWHVSVIYHKSMWVMSHIALHSYQRVMSHLDKSHPVWMRHVTYEQVMLRLRCTYITSLCTSRHKFAMHVTRLMHIWYDWPICDMTRWYVWYDSSYKGYVTSLSKSERWWAGVETQKNVRGEIGGWGRVPFNETYTPSLSTIYDGA